MTSLTEQPKLTVKRLRLFFISLAAVRLSPSLNSKYTLATKSGSGMYSLSEAEVCVTMVSMVRAAYSKLPSVIVAER